MSNSAAIRFPLQNHALVLRHIHDVHREMGMCFCRDSDDERTDPGWDCDFEVAISVICAHDFEERTGLPCQLNL